MCGDEAACHVIVMLRWQVASWVLLAAEVCCKVRDSKQYVGLAHLWLKT